MSDTDAEHRCLVALDKCGCTAMVTVLGYGHDADAYKHAAAEAKRGMEIRNMTVADWKARGWHCAEHPAGPPWWKGNKRRAEDAMRLAGTMPGLGL